MKTITLDNDAYKIPGSWNELTTEQLVYLIAGVRKMMPAQEVKTKMALFCLGAQVARKYRDKTFSIVIGKKEYPVAPEQLSAVADAFDFLLSPPDEEGNFHIDPKLTRNPFPTTLCGCVTAAGPEDALTNITYNQFAMLQTYQQRLETHPDAINEFISIIYKRNAFTTDAGGEPELIRQMSPTVKTAVLWFYLGSLRFIAGQFPRVFSGGEGASGGTAVFDNQMKIIDMLAGGDVTKKDEVRNAMLYDALYTMEMAIERQESMKPK